MLHKNKSTERKRGRAPVVSASQKLVETLMRPGFAIGVNLSLRCLADFSMFDPPSISINESGEEMSWFS